MGGRAKDVEEEEEDAAGPDGAAFVVFEGRGAMVKVNVVPGTIDGKTEEAETTRGGFVVFFPSSFSIGDKGAGGVWMGIL